MPSRVSIRTSRTPAKDLVNSESWREIIEYPIQLFGYLNEQDAEQTRIVSNVTQDTVQELNQLHGFKVDDWFLSSGRCGEIKVHGPYKTADEACKAATAKYGVTKLTSPLLIF
ncbi:TPA: hypothetical protein ACPJ0D_000978 [Vibrio diabolicus]